MGRPRGLRRTAPCQVVPRRTAVPGGAVRGFGRGALRGRTVWEVVVRARVEPEHSIADLDPRGEHEHWHPATRCPDLTAYLQPVHPRHVHVEQHQVGSIASGGAQRFDPVAATVTSYPLKVRIVAATPRTAWSSSATRMRTRTVCTLGEAGVPCWHGRTASRTDRCDGRIRSCRRQAFAWSDCRNR